jgi:hypothetical protein
MSLTQLIAKQARSAALVYAGAAGVSAIAAVIVGVATFESPRPVPPAPPPAEAPAPPPAPKSFTNEDGGQLVVKKYAPPPAYEAGTAGYDSRAVGGAPTATGAAAGPESFRSTGGTGEHPPKR